MYEDYYDDGDDDGERRRRRRNLAWLVVGLLTIGALAWFVLIPTLQNDSVASSSATTATTSNSDRSTTSVVDTTSEPQSTSVPGEQNTSITPRPQYPTLPDGSPLPVLAVLDAETITVSGYVPSDDAVTQVEALVLAMSTSPDATLVSSLNVDPTVPANVGVRLVDLTSTRFAESATELVAAQLTEIDRVASILEARPNMSVTVIGHSDQPGNGASDFTIAEERALDVSTYLVFSGIDPARVSSRAVGSWDSLVLGDVEASVELDRLTEFVFSGLFADAS